MKLILAIAFTIVALSVAAADDPKPVPISEAEAVLALTFRNNTLGGGLKSGLIIAIWGDGRMVWSEDKLHGKGPYRTATIDAKKVTALLAKCDKDGLFEQKKLGDAHYGPDSSFNELIIKSGKKELRMTSWHELYEAGNGIGRNFGAAPLGDSKRLDLLSTEPADYLFFRFVWSETRTKMVELIPSDSKPVKGKLLLKAGDEFWQEEPDDNKPKK